MMPDRFEDEYGTDEDARRRALASLASGPYNMEGVLRKLHERRMAMEAPPVQVSSVPTTQGLAVRQYQPLGSPKRAEDAPASKRLPKDDALDAAFASERENALGAGLSRAGAMASAALTRRKYDAAPWNELERGTSPVQELMAKRAAEREASARDPNSPENIRQRAAIKAVLPNVPDDVLAGMTSAEAGGLFDKLKFGASQASEAEARRLARQESAERYKDAREERALDRQTGNQHFWAQMAESRAARGENHETQLLLAQMAAKERAALKQAEKEAGGRIPAGEAQLLGQADFAQKTLENLDKSFKEKTGALSGVTQYLPGTDAGQYDDERRAAAQMIGTYMEGGKLTDSDLGKYMALLPSPADGGERAKNKVETLRRLIQQRRGAQLEGLRSSGYDTKKFDAQPAPQPPASTAAPPAGKVRVTNGKETLDIDLNDLPAAQAEGFTRAP